MKPLYKFGTRRPAGSPSTCADCQTDPSRNICAVCRAVRPSCEFPAVERARGATGQRCTSCIKPTAEPTPIGLPPVTQFKCDSCTVVMAPTFFHHSMVEDSCPFRMCKACSNQPHNNVCSRCKFLRDANGFLPEQRRRGPHAQLCIVCVETTKKKKNASPKRLSTSSLLLSGVPHNETVVQVRYKSLRRVTLHLRRLSNGPLTEHMRRMPRRSSEL